MNLSSENIIGKGAFSTVYRYSDKLVVKVTEKGTRESLTEELRRMHFASVSGVPCAHVFKVIDTPGGVPGLVMEYLEGDNLCKLIGNEPGKTELYIHLFADFFRTIHAVPFRSAYTENRKTVYLKAIKDGYAENRIDRQLYENMIDFMEHIPERDTFVHDDIHAENIIFHDTEFKLIDLITAGYGSELFDLAGVCNIFYRSGYARKRDPALYRSLSNWKCRRIWHRFLELYYVRADKRELKAISTCIGLLSAIRSCLSLNDASSANAERKIREKEFDHYFRKYRRHREQFIKVMNAVEPGGTERQNG